MDALFQNDYSNFRGRLPLDVKICGRDSTHEPLFHNELDNLDILGLPETVDPIEALLLRRRVPGGVEQEQVAGRGQVEADAA